MKEYEMLRSEILSDLASINQQHYILFSVVAGILTFTFGSEIYWSCMLPYIVILSVYFMENTKRKSICKVGSYLYVFLEGGNDNKSHNWERRVKQFDELYLNKQRSVFSKYTLKYYILSAGSSGITLLKLIGSQNNRIPKLSAALIIISFTIGVCLIILNCEFNYSIVRPKMISNWNTIRNSEPDNKKTSIPIPDNDLNEKADEAEKKKDASKRRINVIGIIVIAVCICISLYLIVTNSNNADKAEITSGYSTEASTISNIAHPEANESSIDSTEISAQEATISQ